MLLAIHVLVSYMNDDGSVEDSTSCTLYQQNDSSKNVSEWELSSSMPAHRTARQTPEVIDSSWSSSNDRVSRVRDDPYPTNASGMMVPTYDPRLTSPALHQCTHPSRVFVSRRWPTVHTNGSSPCSVYRYTTFPRYGRRRMLGLAMVLLTTGCCTRSVTCLYPSSVNTNIDEPSIISTTKPEKNQGISPQLFLDDMQNHVHIHPARRGALSPLGRS